MASRRIDDLRKAILGPPSAKPPAGQAGKTSKNKQQEVNNILQAGCTNEELWQTVVAHHLYKTHIKQLIGYNDRIDGIHQQGNTFTLVLVTRNTTYDTARYQQTWDTKDLRGPVRIITFSDNPDDINDQTVGVMSR